MIKTKMTMEMTFVKMENINDGHGDICPQYSLYWIQHVAMLLVPFLLNSQVLKRQKISGNFTLILPRVTHTRRHPRGQSPGRSSPTASSSSSTSSSSSPSPSSSMSTLTLSSVLLPGLQNTPKS